MSQWLKKWESWQCRWEDVHLDFIRISFEFITSISREKMLFSIQWIDLDKYGNNEKTKLVKK